MSTAKKPKREHKLIIIGTATNRGQAPFDNKEVDIWGTGGTINAPDIPRVDVAFEMHPEGYWKQPAILQLLQKYPGRLVMQDHYDEIPSSSRYPIEAVRDAFYMPTMGKSLYVTNTVSYMFALAYLEGYREIETFGVYMEHDTEYDHQKPNCEFYLGYLHAKGVKITLHGGELLRGKFEYGIEEPPFVRKLVSDAAGLANSMKELDEKLHNLERDKWMQEGAIRYNHNLRRENGGF